MATPVLSLAQFTNVMEALQPGSSQYPQGMAEEYAQYTQNPEQYANTLPGAGSANNDISQRFNSYSALVQGQGTGTTPGATPAQTQSYLNSPFSGSSSGATYGAYGGGTTNNPSGAASTQGEQPPDINYARAYLRQMGGRPLTDTSFDANVSDAQVMDFWNQQHPAPAAPPAPVDTTQPETRALQQMAQIDPTSEALRQNLGMSYLANLNQNQAPAFTPGKAPSAADVQGYLDLYKQIDPTGYAQHQDLATAMNSYLAQRQQQAALGAQLDPSTQREVSQAAREAQSARGNVYGTPQLVQETMQRGSAGEARLQQRLSDLGNALGQQQGYLASGTGLGDIANTLYGQGFSRNLSQYQTQLGALNQAQQGALGYLGSGQTPYQAGSSYLNMAQQNAANAAQGGPQYNPSSLSPGMTGTSQQAPQYGLDIGAQGQNYYSSMIYGQPQPQQSNIPSYIGAAANVAGSLAKAYTGAPKTA